MKLRFKKKPQNGIRGDVGNMDNSFDEWDDEPPDVHWSQKQEMLPAWIARGQDIGATHLIVVGDGQMVGPQYVMPHESVDRMLQLMYIAGHPEEPIEISK